MGMIRQPRKAFTRVKEANSANKKLTVENNACEYGLGSVLIQDGRPLAYASRSLTNTEKRYMQIEKEMLAAVEKFHNYMYGRPVEVITDHKSLEAIARKCLNSAPRRLQNLLLRAKKYDYTITYKPGRIIPVADTLSRALVYNPSREELVHAVYKFPIRDELLNKIRHETANDDALVISKGWPDHKDLVPENIRVYFSYRDKLTVSDGIVMRGSQVVIPDKLKKEMKQRIHKGHMGINSCLRFAKDIIYRDKSICGDLWHMCNLFAKTGPRNSHNHYNTRKTMREIRH